MWSLLMLLDFGRLWTQMTQLQALPVHSALGSLRARERRRRMRTVGEDYWYFETGWNSEPSFVPSLFSSRNTCPAMRRHAISPRSIRLRIAGSESGVRFAHTATVRSLFRSVVMAVPPFSEIWDWEMGLAAYCPPTSTVLQLTGFVDVGP